METFQAEMRHIVLTLKLSEEKQRNYKNELVNVYRTVQKHSNSNPFEKNNSTPCTKQLLKQLREIDELNKSVRTLLRVTLMEHRGKNFVKNANESTATLVAEDKHLTPDPFSIYSTRESQIDVVRQPTQEKYDVKPKSSKSQPNGLDSSILTTLTTDVKLSSEGSQVNLKNDLISIEFKLFTDARAITRMDMMPIHSVENLLLWQIEIPERRKIKCKIRR